MTFGTAFVLRTRHKQTLPATRKAKTMFFQAKKNSRKTTRQTLSTEQLEPKAMFNATAFDTQICFEDRLGSSDMDVNDVVLQVKDVTLDVGPVNQAGYSCENAGTCSDPIWTNGERVLCVYAGTAGLRRQPLSEVKIVLSLKCQIMTTAFRFMHQRTHTQALKDS